MIYTGIDIGLGVTSIWTLNNKEVSSSFKFGNKVQKELLIPEEKPIERYSTYSKLLSVYINTYTVGTIIMENPMSRQGGTGLRIYTLRGALLVALKDFPDEKFKSPTATQIKKYFTGNGGADKQAMIDKCVSRGFKPEDDHDADAIAMALMGFEYDW